MYWPARKPRATFREAGEGQTELTLAKTNCPDPKVPPPSKRPPPGASWASANRRSSSIPTSARWCWTRPRRQIHSQINGMGREPGFPRGRRARGRQVNGRWVLTHMPAKPPGAEAGAALLSRRVIHRNSGRKRRCVAPQPVCCAVTRCGRGRQRHADEEAERASKALAKSVDVAAG